MPMLGLTLDVLLFVMTLLIVFYSQWQLCLRYLMPVVSTVFDASQASRGFF